MILCRPDSRNMKACRVSVIRYRLPRSPRVEIMMFGGRSVFNDRLCVIRESPRLHAGKGLSVFEHGHLTPEQKSRSFQ